MKNVRKEKSFGAKSLFITRISGRGKVKARYKSANYFLLEERIILVKGKDFNEAIKKAKKEAISYESIHENPYGQKVITKFLKCIDVFELYSKVGDLAEIYSINYLVNKKNRIKKILDQHYGNNFNEKLEKKLRQGFLNKEFNKLK